MSITAIALTIATILAGVVNGKSEYIAYNTTAGIVPEKINVHLIPHSHDDVGWLKTVDQYYVGANNSIRVCLSVLISFSFLLFLTFYLLIDLEPI